MSGVYGRKNRKGEWKAWTEAALNKKLQSIYKDGITKQKGELMKQQMRDVLSMYAKREQGIPERRTLATIKKLFPYTAKMNIRKPHKPRTALTKGTKMAQVLSQGRSAFIQAWRDEKARLGYDDMTRAERKEVYAVFRARWKRERGKPIPKKLKEAVSQIKITSKKQLRPTAPTSSELTLGGLGMRRRRAVRGRRTTGNGIIAGGRKRRVVRGKRAAGGIIAGEFY